MNRPADTDTKERLRVGRLAEAELPGYLSAESESMGGHPCSFCGGRATFCLDPAGGYNGPTLIPFYVGTCACGESTGTRVSLASTKMAWGYRHRSETEENEATGTRVVYSAIHRCDVLEFVAPTVCRIEVGVNAQDGYDHGFMVVSVTCSRIALSGLDHHTISVDGMIFELDNEGWVSEIRTTSLPIGQEWRKGATT